MKTQNNDEMAESPSAKEQDLVPSPSSRISVPEIARRLRIGRLAVYSMLEQGIIPGIRLGRRWIITRRAYLAWEESCGVRSRAGLP